MSPLSADVTFGISVRATFLLFGSHTSLVFKGALALRFPWWCRWSWRHWWGYRFGLWKVFRAFTRAFFSGLFPISKGVEVEFTSFAVIMTVCVVFPALLRL